MVYFGKIYNFIKSMPKESPAKKLYRSKTNRIIFGICGGLGEYFKMDPLIFRILFILLGLLQGIGILLYLILAFVIPGGTDNTAGEEQDKDFVEKISKNARGLADEVTDKNSWLSSPRNMLGLIILIIGLMLLTQSLFPGVFVGTFIAIILPLAIIIVGAAFIIKRK